MFSPRSSEKPAAGAILRETALTAVAAALVVLFAASLLLVDRKFYWIDDAQSGATAGYCEIARAWRSGELPLLSRCTWRSSAMACEFPTGVFSPTLELSIILIFNLGLSLALAAAGLSLIHLGILAAGSFRLARRSGLSADLAMLAALVASINGWIIMWGARNWGVCLYSFAWVPWFWWALERIRAGRGGWLAFIPAAIFLFLIVTAGWPVTDAMAALVTAWVMLRTWIERRRLVRLWPFPAAWLAGLLLSAPAWLMVLQFAPYADRARAGGGLALSISWMVPFDALPGLILPNVIALWPVFGTIRTHVSAEMAGGLVPVVVLLGCLWCGGRSMLRALRWELAFCGLGLLLVISPAPMQFAHSFRWLPLFFLGLGLAAGHAFAWARGRMASATAPAPPSGKTNGDAAARVGRRLPNLGRVALVLVLFVWFRELFPFRGIETNLVASGAFTALVVFVWSFIERRFAPNSLPRVWAPCCVVMLTCWIAFVSCRTVTDVPVWNFGDEVRDPWPLDPNVRYLSVHTLPDIFDFEENRFNDRWRGTGDELRFSNTAAYAGLDFVNGYSPMKPAGMQAVFGWEPHGFFDDPADAQRILVCETGPDGLLRRMGVDGLIVSDRFLDLAPILKDNGWEEKAQLQGGRVFQRIGPPSARAYAVPRAEVATDWATVRNAVWSHGMAPAPSMLLPGARPGPTGELHLAPADVTAVEERRNSMSANVKSAAGDGEVLVVFARPWFPGYRAVYNGKPVPVEVYDLMLPAVRLPAGSNGRVVLEYWPASLTVGLWLAGTTAALLALAVVADACRRRLRRCAAPPAAPVPATGNGDGQSQSAAAKQLA
ncbi:MAG TPA: hypothetical protein VMS17_19970 [Gemmataceae bacterium]|nr:hypothetical protein [Gemmataceae bacterium]